MKIIISPAKTFAPVPDKRRLKSLSQPYFSDDTATLVRTLKTLTPRAISTLMQISPKLSNLNHERFQNWPRVPSASKSSRVSKSTRPPEAAALQPAIFAFNGDVYRGLNIETYTQAELNRLNKSLFILSGLYGLLKPFDGINEYRLEMGTRLKTAYGTDLYTFWEDRPAKTLLASLKPNEPLVNLASQEYFKVLKPHLKALTVITPCFKENVRGVYKIVSFKSKYARGLMTSFITKHKLTHPAELSRFDSEGYRYLKEASTEVAPVFIRD